MNLKIRTNVDYPPQDPNTVSPPIYKDYLTIESKENQIGIMTDNPHATLSVKGNLAVGNTYAVYDHSSEETSPGTDLGIILC